MSAGDGNAPSDYEASEWEEEEEEYESEQDEEEPPNKENKKAWDDKEASIK
jgi:hypothetical protein